jgi:hypothetical protein
MSIKSNKKAAATKTTKQAAKAAPEKQADKAAPKLPCNAQSNGQFKFILQLTPINGVKAAPASAPFKPISIANIKAGKATSLTARVDAYHALYTALADNNNLLPLYGDKSVLATMLAEKLITITADGNLKLLERSNKKPGQSFQFNSGFNCSVSNNPNYKAA